MEEELELSNLAVVPNTPWFTEGNCKLLRSWLKLRLAQYRNADIEDDKAGLAAAKSEKQRCSLTLRQIQHL